MKRLKIKWWKVNFNSKSANHIKKSIQNKNISQGIVTEKFEKVISKKLKINNTVMTNNGSIAILMALLALNLKKKDEIILQDRTWISSANAIYLIGAKIKIVDVEKEFQAIDLKKIIPMITSKTKVLILTPFSNT